MTIQTPMQIGSVGKTIAALAIRQLINAGKIDLNATVQRYLPWFRLANVEASQTITIRDLFEHRSELSTADGQDPALYREGPSSEALVRGLTNVQLDRPVRVDMNCASFKRQWPGAQKIDGPQHITLLIGAHRLEGRSRLTRSAQIKGENDEIKATWRKTTDRAIVTLF